MHDPPAGSVVPWQFCEALNAGDGGAPPKMLIGPNGEPPVLVSVTEIGPPVLPMSTLPKSTVLVSMAMSVSTAPTDVGTRATAVAARPTRATAATTRRGACCMGGVLP